MSEQIKIDDTYTYVFDAGRVEILRHGQNWLTIPNGAKAWIAAANQIEDLREQVAKLEIQSQEDLRKWNMQVTAQRAEIDRLKRERDTKRMV